MTRTANMTRTRTGIIIGCAYQPPAHQMGSHAERIQAALLRKPLPNPTLRAYIVAASIFLALAVSLALIFLFTGAWT